MFNPLFEVDYPLVFVGFGSLSLDDKTFADRKAITNGDCPVPLGVVAIPVAVMDAGGLRITILGLSCVSEAVPVVVIAGPLVAVARSSALALDTVPLGVLASRMTNVVRAVRGHHTMAVG